MGVPEYCRTVVTTCITYLGSSGPSKQTLCGKISARMEPPRGCFLRGACYSMQTHSERCRGMPDLLIPSRFKYDFALADPFRIRKHSAERRQVAWVSSGVQ